MAIFLVYAASGVLNKEVERRGGHDEAAGARAQCPELMMAVAGQQISREELDRPLAARIFDLERQIYALRKNRLDQAIVQSILPNEAARRQISQQKLVDEILAGGVEVSQDEIAEYIDGNPHLPASWNGSREELKQTVTDQLGRQKGYRKIVDYATSLGYRYGLKVYLQEPKPPMVSVNPGKDPAFGPSTAAVTVMEFSDYQCSACRKAHETVRRISGMYPDSIRWVFKDFAMNPSSRIAAEAARCANEQGKFAEYRDLLFSETAELTPYRLTACAKQLGLDMTAFNGCRESLRYRDDVENNVKEGSVAGISMTPTYIINGKMIPGAPPLDEFKQLISKELSGGEGKSPGSGKQPAL